MLRTVYGYVLRRALDFEVEDQRKEREVVKDMEVAG